MINKNLNGFLNQINKKEKLETLKYICLRKDTHKAKNFINNYIEDKHSIYDNLIGDLKSTNDTKKPIIETLIKCKFEENYWQTNKETLFKKAYDVKNEEIMEFISSCGSNLELWRDTHNRSLLKIALDKNDLNEMKKLLKYGANPDYYRNSNKERLVYEAFYKNKKEALKLLLNHGANPNGQILLKAIEKKDIEICEMLIKASSDPYCEVEPYIGKKLNSMPIFNMDYNTFKIFYDKGLIGEEIITKMPMNTFIQNTIKAFNSSSNKDRIKIFEFIFTKIIKPKDWESKNGDINIQNAMSNDELIEGLKMLHRLGFNLNYKSQDGYTPLETALKNEQFKAFLYLIELGINQNFNSENKEEFSKAILRAYKEKNYEILKAISKNRLLYDSFSNKINKKLLLKAYQDKNIEELRSILKNKVDPDLVKNKNDLSLLHSACIEGIENIAKLLLEYGANPNLKSKEQSYTPIHCAARNGHTKIIKLLAKSKNINFNIEDKKGFTPLDYALIYKHFETMKALLDIGTKKINKPENYKKITYEEYKSNHNKNLEIIFKSGIHPDLCRDKYERTLLFAACLSRDIDKIKLLLKYGANPNLQGKDKYGYAPIHCIAQSGDIDLLKIIINNSKVKIDFDIKDKSNHNAMYHAFKYKKFKMMEIIKDSGSKEIPKFENAIIIKEYNENNIENLENIFKSGIHPGSYVNNDGITLLHIASYDKGKIEMIKLLLKYGANPNLKGTKYGYSSIHHASQKGHIKIIKLLASCKNINFDIRDKKGFTPLDHALRYKQFKTMQTLIDLGAKNINNLEDHKKIISKEYRSNHNKNLKIIFKSGIHPDFYKDKYNRTLLYDACLSEDIEKIKLLLKYGANFNLQGKDKYGYSPIHCIAQMGNTDLLKTIINNSKVKIDFDIKDNFGNSPIYHAFRYKKFKMMEILKSCGAKEIPKSQNAIIIKEYNENNIANLEIIFKCGIHPDTFRDKKGKTILHYACTEGKTEMVNLLLKYGANPNLQSRDEYGYTPIHWAMQNGHSKVLEIFKKYKTNLNILDKKEVTPLIRAYNENQYETLKKLLELKENPNLWRDKKGETLLHYACADGKEKMLKLLLKYGANPNLQGTDEWNYTPIHWAAQKGNVEIIKLIANKSKIKVNFDIKDKKGYTPLDRAFQSKHYKTMQTLINSGAIDMPNVKNHIDIIRNEYDRKNLDNLRIIFDSGIHPDLWKSKNKETLLHCACISRQKEIVKLLLEKGADPNLQSADEYGYTPIHWAAQKGFVEILKILKSFNADFNILDKRGINPLVSAYNENDLKTMKILLERGADPNLWKDTKGETLLHYACRKGKTEIIKLLLEYGANPNLQSKDAFGYTPIHWVAQEGYNNIIDLIADNSKIDIDFDIKDKKGYTPLDRAFQSGHFKVMEILTNLGAEDISNAKKHINIIKDEYDKNNYKNLEIIFELNINPDKYKDKDGETLLHYACKDGKLAMVKLLLEYGANPNLKGTDKYGYTPIHWAVQKGHNEIINIIANNSMIEANFDIKDKKGYTPLDRALEKKHFKTMKILMNEGAKHIPNAKNNADVISNEYINKR